MSDLGLRYGDEFRPIRELFAGGGKSAGRVSLSEAISDRAAEYALHPVLLDGALQVFSAGAKTVEDRKIEDETAGALRQDLVPAFAGSFQPRQRRVLHFNEELIEGRIALYDEAGRPCVLVDGFRAISMTAARRPGSSGGGRDLLYHIEWERSASDRRSFEAATRALGSTPGCRQHRLGRSHQPCEAAPNSRP